MASRGVNKVILVGNLGNDPEVRYMPNGNAVANVSLATSETWKDKIPGSSRKDRVAPVVFFNRLAEIVEQYVKKGTKLYVEGRLQTRSWEQDGVKRYSTEVVANEMQMLDSRGGVSQDFGGSQMAAAPAASPVSSRLQRRLRISTILTTTFHSSAIHRMPRAVSRCTVRVWLSGSSCERDSDNSRRPASGIKRRCFVVWQLDLNAVLPEVSPCQR